jgi:hypothetical protein
MANFILWINAELMLQVSATKFDQLLPLVELRDRNGAAEV